MPVALTVLLTVLCFFNGFHDVVSTNHCVKNRHIFTEKYGRVHDGVDHYKGNSRCEWLIKGDSGETVTITFNHFDLEYGYDRLFIHDGASKQSPLLASKTGIHDGFSITSTGPLMYIVLHTDSGEHRQGFDFFYSINACPNNCSNSGNGTSTTGVCTEGGTCECYGGTYGRYCQYHWCSDNVCNQALGHGVCNVTSKKCMCQQAFYGESCAISDQPNVGSNHWYSVTSHSDVFGRRAAHVSGYFSSINKLLVHGGFSLNLIHDDLVEFDFVRNGWQRRDTNAIKPPALYNHAAVVHVNAFILFGGEDSQQQLSNQLWSYDVINSNWTQLVVGEKANVVPGIVGHSLTAVGTKLYVIGGRLKDDAASSDIYVFDLTDNSWSKKVPMFGKPSTLRLYGHSASYYAPMQSIIVFGGFYLNATTNIATNTNLLRVYNIKENVWSIIGTSWSSSPVPPPTAFHGAVVSGDYLIIHGGWVETHAYSITNKTYYYDLHCHVWKQASSLATHSGGGKEVSDPKSLNKPLLSHSVVLKDGHTLLVSGGFNHLSSLGGLRAFKLPNSVVHLNSSRNSSGTSENLCSDSCIVFTSCESCSSQNRCGWCPIYSACYNINKAQEKCNLCQTGSCNRRGWWGSNGRNIVSKPQSCQVEDNPPGLTHVEYFAPKNGDYPDVVKILQRTSWREYASGKEHEMRWLGKVYPYLGERNVDAEYTLDLRGVGVRIWLNISEQNGILETKNVSKVIKQQSEAISSTKSGKRDVPFQDMSLFPVKSGDENDPDKLWYEFRVAGTVDYSMKPFLKISWYKSGWPDYYYINQSSLERYHTNNCAIYTHCMGCIVDASCGWCPSTSTCVNVASPSSTCKDGLGNSLYLQRRQEQCTVCPDYFECDTCIKNKYCAWHLSNGCIRKELTANARTFHYISSSNSFFSTCFSSCSSHTSQDRCLTSHGCIWCTGRSTCLSFNDYILQNQFGQCYTFYDHDTYKQKNCSLIKNCNDCLKQFSCGWCHNEQDPRIGKCSFGDFSGPSEQCTNIANTPVTKWSYNTCPDVDECTLNIDTCKANSTCVNKNPGYDCKCDQGFEGDGKKKCTKTCWPPCGDHGKCNANYQCECDLGWKGDNCSIDCGCHGHSTCVNQTGVCDQCQDYTTGEQCQFCVNGSYGNATTFEGCKKCDCHGYGDASRNICDPLDGTCYCTNNTDGINCERCKPGFSGDPKVGICVLSCLRSNILKEATSGFVSPYNVARDKQQHDVCLWTIASFNITHDQIIYGANQSFTPPSNMFFRLHATHGMSCFDSMLAVYDGVPPNPRIQLKYSTSPFKLLGTVCGPLEGSQQTVFRSTTGVLTIVFQGWAAVKPVKIEYGSESGFLGEYSVLECPHACSPPFQCIDLNGDGVESCTCPPGWSGMMCEQKICPNGCNNGTKQGRCDQWTNQCICERGFTGTDCSRITNNNNVHFTVQRISNLDFLGGNLYRYTSYGSTMEHDSSRSMLYVLGNADVNSLHYFHQYDIVNDVWTTNDGKMPTNRYLHCSFIYENGMYIYGGITKAGMSNEVWKFDFGMNTWYQLQYATVLDSLAGHSCTVIDDLVYIIGGYVTKDGLNEYVHVLNMKNHDYYPVKFSGGLEPVGIYSHIAVYDKETKLVYIHGGMAFYDEKIQLSPNTYAFDPAGIYWDVIQPYPGDPVPTLLGHVAYLHNDVVYIMGGYNDRDGYNEHIYMWKIKCNRWSLINGNDVNIRGDGRLDKLFSSAATINGSLYIFGGLNENMTPGMTVFTPPQDFCTNHTTKDTCLGDHGCSWCANSSTSPSNGVCFRAQSNVSCNSIVETTPCTLSENENRECRTLSSCDSCLSNYRGTQGRCQWCRCMSSTPGVCVGRGKPCDCSSALVIPSIDKCYQAKCATSTCKNCNYGCFWTDHFRFKSENVRMFSPVGFTYNCFMRDELLNRLTENNKRIAMEDVDRPCPSACSRYTTCQTCTMALGVNAGSEGCIWSEKRRECLSVEIVPAKCSNGMCGQLYSKTTNQQCPAKCSEHKTCLQCIQATECGWCSTSEKGFGDCMEGDNLAPYHGTCGVSQTSNGISIIDHTLPSFNRTWAFSDCPVENECENGHSNCKENEVCEDRIHGFVCKCKEGYKLHDKTCVPHCQNGCGNGTCVEPEKCECYFGFTGATCNISCPCNGHSNCNESSLDVCLQCHNNTQGKYCEKCKPLFVGNPTNSGKCTPCFDVCNGNTGVCLVKSEADAIPEEYRENSTVVMKEVAKVKNGPLYETDAMCLLCKNHSRGEKCDECNQGFFLLNRKCVQCDCNGHGSICNPKTGSECECKQNTVSNPTCKSNCYKEQCTVCLSDYVGDPRDEQQCYKRMNTKQVELISAKPGDVTFFAATPSFTNVDIRVSVDVVAGSYEVFITDNEKQFKLKVNDTVSHLHVSGASPNTGLNRGWGRRRRRAQPLEYVSAIQASKDYMTTYAKYERDVLVITNIRKRAVITISHGEHDLRKKWFYLAILPINRTTNPSTGAPKAFVYYRQDLPRIDLLLFFLVLAVILLFILSGFIVGMKVRTDMVRNRRREDQRHELNAMKSRPLATFTLLFEPNEDLTVIRKRKNRSVRGNKNSKHLCVSSNEMGHFSRHNILPVAIQDTEDGLAAIVTSFVQFPDNEISRSNYYLSSGICQLNSQQLVQVRTNTHGNGKHVNTRILNTVA